jgi:hypothetical protein
MKLLKLEKLSTGELLDIRDCIDSLLKSRTSDERRNIQRLLGRIAQTGGVISTTGFASRNSHGTRARRGAKPRRLKARLKHRQMPKKMAAKKRAAR